MPNPLKYALIWTGFAILSVIIGVNAHMDTDGGTIFSVVFATLMTVAVAMIENKTITNALQRKKEEKQRQQQAEERQVSIANGTWSFPWDTFYHRCKEAGFTELSNPFWEEKAKALADKILGDENIPEQYRSLYNTKERLAEYLLMGRKEEERQLQESEENKKRPQSAELTDEQREAISRQEALKDKLGKEKREAMLREIVSRIGGKIYDIKKAQEDMQKLGFIVAQSASQQKTVDTATVAGLANGLGGAGAALYATADAMSQNAKIEAENRRNREAVNQFAAGMYSNSINLSSDIRTLEKQREPYRKALEALDTKVVIKGADTQELYKSLHIEKTTVEKLQTGALSIKTTLKTTYRPDVPENVKTTMDGTLTGKVYAGDLYVGDCILPLPLFGVECGNPNPTQAEALCDHYSANDQPYRVEFSPNKLWVMEL